MRLFESKRKKREREEGEAAREAQNKRSEDFRREQVEGFKEFKDVGQTFNYCGVKMLVESVHFQRLSIDPELGYGLIVTAAYKDKNGDLKREKFNSWQIPIIITENS